MRAIFTHQLAVCEKDCPLQQEECRLALPVILAQTWALDWAMMNWDKQQKIETIWDDCGVVTGHSCHYTGRLGQLYKIQLATVLQKAE